VKSGSNTELAGQEVHLLADVQDEHVVGHAAQVPLLSYWLEVHSVLQTPFVSVPVVQAVQSDAEAPEHCEQEGLQA
jgi:hypothetical protein